VLVLPLKSMKAEPLGGGHATSQGVEHPPIRTQSMSHQDPDDQPTSPLTQFWLQT
jgi:hypothetical protein